MKKTILAILVVGGVLIASIATASTLMPSQGGTGFSTTSVANVGNFLQVATTSPYLGYTFAVPGGTVNYWSLSGTSLYPTSTAYNLGIGTTTPSTPLYVVGSSTISNDITANVGHFTQIYDSGATSTQCETVDSVTGLLKSGNCVTSLNDLTGKVLATSTAGSGITIASSSGNLVFSLSTSTLGFAPLNRNLNTTYPLSGGGDLSLDRTFSIASAGYVSSTVAGTGISVSASTGAVTITNIGVQTFNSATGTITGVNSVNAATGTVSISAGNGITISTTTSATTINATQHIPWTESDTTSSATNYIPIWTFDTACTISKVYENSTSTANTITYNLLYGANNLASSSMFKVFTTSRTVTGLGAVTSTATFASSTPSAGNSLWLWTQYASTTATHIDVICQ